ncbi:unnamed protein product [Tuber melanosporum]|uniref:(Perigord truffle) hypothetical protein n=1 Tax=Tuber melanosporum (strain Mel28) TaxID=656061 RepID=D5G5H4_TUBMM|nr:uncharacterized protein GSTUM_00004336001 [Tuber melanosporum]CAZ79767.1 unnamed protein product [Tuber melanosporum]
MALFSCGVAGALCGAKTVDGGGAWCVGDVDTPTRTVELDVLIGALFHLDNLYLIWRCSLVWPLLGGSRGSQC